MQLYEMQVSKTAIYRTAPVRIPKGIIGAAVKLSFSPEWEGLTKTVIFRAGDITKDVLHVEDMAVIPAECTRETGALLEIGVYGTAGEETVAIPTLWAAIGRVTEAADPSGDTTTEPSLPVWAQLQTQIRQLEEQGVTQNEVEQAVRDFFGGELPVGKTTPEGGEIFNDYENNQALAPYSKADGVGNRAGICGYKLIKVTSQADNTAFTITVDDVDMEDENKAANIYTKGDVLCFDGQGHYYDDLKITALSISPLTGNSLISVKSYKVDSEGKAMSLDKVAVDSSADEWENWVYVLEKPDAGEPAKVAYGAYAGGVGSVAIGRGAFSHGRDNQSVGSYAHTAGRKNVAHYAGYAVGYKNSATGENAAAQGSNNIASGNSAHAEGTNTTASGQYAHSEGNQTVSGGKAAHAEGDRAKATGDYSHAEGSSTVAEGKSSHAEGGSSKAFGMYAHAEGRMTRASGAKSHAEGDETIATGESQHVQGKYNVEDTTNEYAHIVGGGESDTDRKNIHTLDWEGNAEFLGDVFVGTSKEKLAKVKEIPNIYDWAKAAAKPGYTAAEVGAAPVGLVHLVIQVESGTDAELMEIIGEIYAQMPDNTVYYAVVNFRKEHEILGGPAYVLEIFRRAEKYGIIKADSYTGFSVRRTLSGGSWQPWEWVNPPLVAGVEYRTTELFNGKPVYVKLVSLGKPTISLVKGQSQAISVEHGINADEYNAMVRCSAKLAGKPLPWQSNAGVVALSYEALAYDSSSSKVWVKFFARDGNFSISNHACYVTIYFTKK